jgi:apolipoprotein D and lipocalin family protein
MTSNGFKKLGILVIVGLLAACASTPIAPALTLPNVDLAQFAGRWYVLANVPYFAERGKVGSYVEYQMRPDGRLDDFYFFRKESLQAPIQKWSGIATVLDKENNARMKASFIWPISTEFWVAWVDASYTTALVITPDRKLAWIYARTPTIDPAQRNQLKQQLAAMGVDIATLKDIPQLAM